MFSLIAFLIFGLCSTSSIYAFQITKEALQFSPGVRTFTLASGLRYYIVKNKKPEHRAEIRLVVNAGSLLEDNDQRGLAHLLEHVAFLGTRRFPEQGIVKFLEGRGMTFGSHTNAYTSSDETVYQLQVPSDSLSVLGTALDITADWVSAITLDSTAIEKERSVVIEEWRMRELGMQARINTAFYKIFYKGSRYGERLPIGTKLSLDTFKVEAVRRFYRDWYNPANMALIVVGDIMPDSVQKLIESRLGGIPTQTPKRSITQERAAMQLFPTDTNRAPRIITHIDKELHVTVCETHWATTADVSQTHKQYKQEILRSLTMSCINNRFNERAMSSTKPPFRKATVQWNTHDRINASVSLAVEPSSAMFTSYEEALKELRRMLNDGFLPAEIARAKTNMLKSAELRFKERDNNQSVNIAVACVSHFLTGNVIVEPSYLLHLDTTMIANASAEEVRKTAQILIPLGSSRQLTFLGVPPQDSIGISEASIRAVLARADTARIEKYQETTIAKNLLKTIPPLGKIIREKKYEKTGVTEWLLSNGVRILLKPTDFQQDQILLQSYAQGGMSLADESQYFAAKMAAEQQDPLLCGVGDFSASDLRKYLTGKVVGVKPYTGTNYHGMNGSSSAADLETMLQLFYALHTTPRADSISFLAAKEQQLQAFGNRTNSPFTLWQDLVDSVLNGNHYTIRAAKRSEIEQWRHLDSGFAFYKRLFTNMRGGTIVLVGNIDIQRIKPLILRYCASLPAKLFPSKFRDIGGYPLSGVHTATLNKGQDAQGYAITAVTGFLKEWNPSSDIQAEVLSEILNTKLRETLRNDAGGVYACDAGISVYEQPLPRFVSSLYFPCEPNRVQALQEKALKLIRDIKNGAITEQELRDTKAKLFANREPTMKDNSQWLGRISFWTQLGYTPDKILEYNDILSLITLKNVQDGANIYFNESNISTFFLFPEAQ